MARILPILFFILFNVISNVERTEAQGKVQSTSSLSNTNMNTMISRTRESAESKPQNQQQQQQQQQLQRQQLQKQQLLKLQQQKQQQQQQQQQQEQQQQQQQNDQKATAQTVVRTSEVINSIPEATQTTIGPETATTWDGRPCSIVYAGHRDNPHKYHMAKIENDFSDVHTFTCHPSDLVWKPQLCRCDWPELELDALCGDLRSHPSGNKHMYQQLVNGRWEDAYCNIIADNMVWVKEQCQCNWDTSVPLSERNTKNKQTELPKANTDCKVLLNLTMEKSLENHVREGYRVEIKKKSAIRFFKVKGSEGFTAVLRKAPLTVPVLVGNDLTSIMHTSFNFKVHKNKMKYDKFITMMSNGCISYKGRENPSIEIGFAPYNQTFKLQFRTYAKSISAYFQTAAKAINDWYNVVLYLQDGRLTMRINGEISFSSRIPGKVAITSCPLQITDHTFEGYVDEVEFIKQCKYPRTRKL